MPWIGLQVILSGWIISGEKLYWDLKMSQSVPCILKVHQKSVAKSDPCIRYWEYKDSKLVSVSNNGPKIAPKGLK